jgi:hypothetical protein
MVNISQNTNAETNKDKNKLRNYAQRFESGSVVIRLEVVGARQLCSKFNWMF